MQQLIEAFTLENVNRAPAKFDEEKCAWMNQQHLMQLSPEAFAQQARPYAENAGLALDERYAAAAASIQEKVRVLTEVPEALGFYFNPDYPFAEEAIAKVKNNESAASLLEQLAEAFSSLAPEEWDQAKQSIGATAKANGAKPGQLMFPTRVALSGMAGGPDLGDILHILGQEESVRRLRKAVEQLS